jgi:hypothetical protein
MTFPDLANIWAQSSSITLYGTDPFYFHDRDLKTATHTYLRNAKVKYKDDTAKIPESLWCIMTTAKTDKENPTALGNEYIIYGASASNIIVDFDKKSIEGTIGLEKMNVQITRDIHEFIPGGYTVLHRLAHADSKWSTSQWQIFSGQIVRGETYKQLAETLKRNIEIDVTAEPVDLSGLVVEIENGLQAALYNLPRTVERKINRSNRLLRI